MIMTMRRRIIMTLSSSWWARYVQGKSCLSRAACLVHQGIIITAMRFKACICCAQQTSRLQILHFDNATVLCDPEQHNQQLHTQCIQCWAFVQTLDAAWCGSCGHSYTRQTTPGSDFWHSTIRDVPDEHTPAKQSNMQSGCGCTGPWCQWYARPDQHGSDAKHDCDTKHLFSNPKHILDLRNVMPTVEF